MDSPVYATLTRHPASGRVRVVVEDVHLLEPTIDFLSFFPLNFCGAFGLFGLPEYYAKRISGERHVPYNHLQIDKNDQKHK